jgi:hypothetical protein
MSHLDDELASIGMSHLGGDLASISMSRLDGELASITWQARRLLRQPRPPAGRRTAPLLSRLVRRAGWPRMRLHPTDHVWPALRDYPYGKEYP